jgi:hypothetical protein
MSAWQNELIDFGESGDNSPVTSPAKTGPNLDKENNDGLCSMASISDQSKYSSQTRTTHAFVTLDQWTEFSGHLNKHQTKRTGWERGLW